MVERTGRIEFLDEPYRAEDGSRRGYYDYSKRLKYRLKIQCTVPMEEFCIVDHCESKGNDDSDYTCDPADSKARNHEYLHGYQDKSHNKKQDLP